MVAAQRTAAITIQSAFRGARSRMLTGTRALGLAARGGRNSTLRRLQGIEARAGATDQHEDLAFESAYTNSLLIDAESFLDDARRDARGANEGRWIARGRELAATVVLAGRRHSRASTDGLTNSDHDARVQDVLATAVRTHTNTSTDGAPVGTTPMSLLFGADVDFRRRRAPVRSRPAQTNDNNPHHRGNVSD